MITPDVLSASSYFQLKGFHELFVTVCFISFSGSVFQDFSVLPLNLFFQIKFLTFTTSFGKFWVFFHKSGVRYMNNHCLWLILKLGTRDWFRGCTHLLVVQLFHPWLHIELLSEYHLLLVFICAAYLYSNILHQCVSR